MRTPAESQLPLPFELSAPSRLAAARKRTPATPAAERRLFPLVPQLDVSLHTASEAMAVISGAEWEATLAWLEAIVGPTRPLRSRRVAFPAGHLDRLVSLRPPAQVSLDAAATAVARALWAARLGLAPLEVNLSARRLVASSRRWPAGFAVRDAPWTAISALLQLRVPLTVDPQARKLMRSRLATTGTHVATAALAGSAVLIETEQPAIIEALGLPALAYAGLKGTGLYRMPLLAAEPLLSEPAVRLGVELEAAIRKATQRPRPLRRPTETFPWELYGFQARDAADAERILRTTGGVLLAGDMGSGKTTVSLALAAKLELWPLLVVAPLAAFSTWQRQLDELGVTHLLATEAPQQVWARLEEERFDAVVVSYDRVHAFLEALERYGFAGCIADELQRIKSAGSRRSKAMRHLAGVLPVRIGLSGTPLTNTIHDVLPLGAFLAPGQWPPRANQRDLSDLYVGDDPETALADHLSTLMVRRRMEDTGLNLPKLRRLRSYVQLTYDQQRAIAELVEQARADRASGELTTKMHAFVRLQRLRQIIASPAAAGVAGVNPKLEAALELTEEFVAQGRKIVLFVADRDVYVQLGKRLDTEGIGWVGVWGSTPPAERIASERRFHTDDHVKVFLGTIQAASESLTLSPTATATVFVSYVYSAAALAQAEARIYRANATAEQVEVVYIHATAPGGTLDDRLVEILMQKQALFSRVIDRREHVDDTQTTLTVDDLLYLLSGDDAGTVGRTSATDASTKGASGGTAEDDLFASAAELAVLDTEAAPPGAAPAAVPGRSDHSDRFDTEVGHDGDVASPLPRPGSTRAASRRLREEAEREMLADQERRKLNARTSAHRRKGANRFSDEILDDGAQTTIIPSP
jgi:superfamily II DNA or RNA helicase